MLIIKNNNVNNKNNSNVNNKNINNSIVNYNKKKGASFIKVTISTILYELFMKAIISNILYDLFINVRNEKPNNDDPLYEFVIEMYKQFYSDPRFKYLIST